MNVWASILDKILGIKVLKEKNIIANEVIERLKYLEAYYVFTQNKISKTSDGLESDIKLLSANVMPKSIKDTLTRRLEKRNKTLEYILRK